MGTPLRARQPGASLARTLVYEACRRAARLTLRLCFGLRAQGVEHVPATGALLIVANHESYLDPPCIGSSVTQRHLTYVARAGLFAFKPFAWLIGTLNSIPIREDQGDAAAIREILARLARGQAVLIFPEGSRTPDGEMRDFKRGVALLLKRAKCPVVPAAIDGAFERWPVARRWPRVRGPRVRVLFGQPIPASTLLAEGTEQALAHVERDVRALRARLEGARTPPHRRDPAPGDTVPSP
ncbi:MAG: lysophospholipid acyltransferase family protein [Planctomycetota bacterium]|nr:lysophospholipid acyltransferase family protein [Planctomycetota bacterium]